MTHRNTKKLLITVALSALGVTTLGMLTGHLTAQGQVPLEDIPAEGEADAESDAAIVVGTYTPRLAFQEHPAQEDLQKAAEAAQRQMQQAQQDGGDQQKMQQIQQQYEHKRTQAVEQYQRDVDKVIPDVAEAANVKVVTLEVVYMADDVETKDITPDVIDAFSEEEDEEEDQEQQAPAPLPEEW